MSEFAVGIGLGTIMGILISASFILIKDYIILINKIEKGG